MTDPRPWQIHLTTAAKDDFRNILRWTEEHFGEAQARTYADTLTRAIRALAAGPRIAGARERDDVAHGLLALHVARKGRKGRHVVLYRVASSDDPPVIAVLRLLHDSMDLPRHFPSEDDHDA